MNEAYDEPTQSEQVQDVEGVPVHIVASEATREAAPEFANCMTWQVDTFANMGRPRRLLPRRYRRDKARILIPALTNTTIIINSKEEPLMQAIPIGYTVGGTASAQYELEWVSQEPCFAVLSSGAAPISISVLDQSYEET